MAAADMEPGPARVEAYADEVLALILEDCAEGVMPWSVDGFSELHTFVDANCYLIDVGQVYDPSLADSMEEINSVEDMVDARIKAGALVMDLIRAADATVGVDELIYGSLLRKRQLIEALRSTAPTWEVTFSGVKAAAVAA